MPDIRVPTEYRRQTGEAIFQWYKKGGGTIHVMPPEQETPNGTLFVAVPNGALAHLKAVGIPFERR
jgi:hypothetical protein